MTPVDTVGRERDSVASTLKTALTTFVFALFASTAVVGKALAAAPEEARAALERRDCTAVLLFSPLAERCNAYAQSLLGICYESSKDVSQDYVEAMKWHRLAAAQDIEMSQTSIGVMYAGGLGVA